MVSNTHKYDHYIGKIAIQKSFLKKALGFCISLTIVFLKVIAQCSVNDGTSNIITIDLSAKKKTGHGL